MIEFSNAEPNNEIVQNEVAESGKPTPAQDLIPHLFNKIDELNTLEKPFRPMVLQFTASTATSSAAAASSAASVS